MRYKKCHELEQIYERDVMNRKQLHSKFTFWFLAFVLVLPQLAIAKSKTVNPDKAADIRKLIKMSRLEDMVLLSANNILDQILPMLKRAMATNSPAINEAIIEIAKNATLSLVGRQIWSPGGLVDRIVPLYNKHYTREEIKALIRFYKTPLGQKVASLRPEITREGIIVAEQWLAYLKPLLTQAMRMSLEKEGYVLVKKKQK